MLPRQNIVRETQQSVKKKQAVKCLSQTKMINNLMRLTSRISIILSAFLLQRSNAKQNQTHKITIILCGSSFRHYRNMVHYKVSPRCRTRKSLLFKIQEVKILSLCSVSLILAFLRQDCDHRWIIQFMITFLDLKQKPYFLQLALQK